MTHWRDSSTCVSYIVWTEFIFSKWVTSHTKRHNSIAFVTWLIDVTQVHVCHISSTCVSYIAWTKFMFSKWVTSHTKRHNSITCVTWLIDVTQVHVCHILSTCVSYIVLAKLFFSKWVSSQSKRHNSITCVTWLIEMTHWHDSSTCVIYQVHVCYVLCGRNSFFPRWVMSHTKRHNSITCVTWLIDVTQVHVSYIKYVCVMYCVDEIHFFAHCRTSYHQKSHMISRKVMSHRWDTVNQSCLTCNNVTSHTTGRDSIAVVTRLIYMCDMTHLCLWHDSHCRTSYHTHVLWKESYIRVQCIYISALEASWRRVFDPCTPLLFDLYHYLEQNGYFLLVPEHAPGPSS